MIRRVYLLVEGQTEEAFVRELLMPYYANSQLYLTPVIVSTSPGHKGGVMNYGKIRPQVLHLCRQDARAHVSTLFDLYALPGNFPGKQAPDYPARGSGQQKAACLEARFAQDVDQPNFILHLMVHEFEALLFSHPEKFGDWVDDVASIAPLRAAAQAHDSPEDINDSPHTAPSKRILAAMPSYQKTFHGPLIACDIGLDVMRAACPHFRQWLERLENLPVLA